MQRSWLVLSAVLSAGCGSALVPSGDGGDVPSGLDGSDRRSCVSNADCRAAELCDGSNACGAVRYCASTLSRACVGTAVTFCGCDNTDFQALESCPGRAYRFIGSCRIVPPPPPPPPPPPRDGGTGCTTSLGTCANNTSCPASRCPDGSLARCFCSDGRLSMCSTCALPPPDAGVACMLPDGRPCADGTSCVVGRCPDGSATSCFCSRGMLRCTGGCPLPPPDAGSGCRLPNGMFCPQGVACAAGDGCNVCACDPSGGVRCTERGCADAGMVRDAGRPPSPCDSQDARGEGACAGFFGYAWNGVTCVAINGCRCVGRDCPSLDRDPMMCTERRAGCADPGSDAGAALPRDF